MAALASLSLPAYVSRLRRAFLLKVHPDRFRSRPDDVKKEQATLVQVLTDRMGEADFIAFASQKQPRFDIAPLSSLRSTTYTSYPYSLETKNGDVIKTSIQLNSSPQQIIKRMADSINFPPPPTSTALDKHVHYRNDDFHSMRNEEVKKYSCYSLEVETSNQLVDELIWNAGLFGRGQYNYNQQFSSSSSSDRNLISFLRNLDPNSIRQRKLNRINASAAALTARRAFQFAAIDGTGLGWSSSSLSISLSRLAALHEEHRGKLQTNSFYPFRLLLSSDEFLTKIDLYGGIIRLNPAATPLQWLSTLQEVTENSIHLLKQNQKSLEHHLSLVKHVLDVQVKKGYSCEPEDYHKFIKEIAKEPLHVNSKECQRTSMTVVNNASLVIESKQACRRGGLRKDGNFEAGTGMNIHDIRSMLIKFSQRSNERIHSESLKRAEFKVLHENVLHEFGFQRVNRASALVSYDQMSMCLLHLLSKDEKDKSIIRGCLAGEIIGVAGRGQPIHLGDDGAIILPWNFC